MKIRRDRFGRLMIRVGSVQLFGYDRTVQGLWHLPFIRGSIGRKHFDITLFNFKGYTA